MKKKIIYISLIFIGLFCAYMLFQNLEWSILFIRDKPVVIEDSYKVKSLLKSQTPVKVEIKEDKWGRAVLDDPDSVFDVWNLIKDLHPHQKGGILSSDHRITGKVYFMDGSYEKFGISDNLKFGDFYLLGQKEQRLFLKLTQIVQNLLYTGENLENQIEAADEVHIYDKDNDYPNQEPVELDFEEIEELKELVNNSWKVTVLSENRGYFDAKFNISLLKKDNKGKIIRTISVLSPELFAFQENATDPVSIIYFREADLYDFSCRVMGLDREVPYH